jgi:hypothetical protein
MQPLYWDREVYGENRSPVPRSMLIETMLRTRAWERQGSLGRRPIVCLVRIEKACPRFQSKSLMVPKGGYQDSQPSQVLDSPVR